MEGDDSMPYKEWKKQVKGHIFPLPNALPLEEEYPTVDFRHLYKAGLEPARAAEAAKAIHWFTKPEYKPTI